MARVSAGLHLIIKLKITNVAEMSVFKGSGFLGK